MVQFSTCQRRADREAQASNKYTDHTACMSSELKAPTRNREAAKRRHISKISFYCSREREACLDLVECSDIHALHEILEFLDLLTQLVDRAEVIDNSSEDLKLV